MRKTQPKKMLAGHAYARALRAHICFLLNLSFHMCLIETIHDMLLNKDFSNENIVHE